MRLAAFLAAALVLLVAGRPAAAQEGAYRFEITRVNDTTFVFDVGRQGWVAARQRGIAVDPGRRDALIARFEVVQVRSGEATALVTGQTTRLSTDYVALLERPAPKWYQRGPFWLGALIGAVAGGLVGAAI